MLRVGLTGGLGSGKSTVAGFFRELGVHVIEADAVGRSMMEPGQPVFAAIVSAFGASVVRPDGTLDRRRLAELAFGEGRLTELNRIVHPPVIAAQEQWMDALFAREPDAVAMVESALIFEADRDRDQGGSVPGWRKRFDRIVLVTAPADLKIERYVARLLAASGMQGNAQAERARADARSRLRAQIPDAEKVPLCDYVIENASSLDAVRRQTAAIYGQLQELSRQRPGAPHAPGRNG